ncbi:MAG: outer membrane beta-barrel protein [Steroidobacteraceae bacterium]
MKIVNAMACTLMLAMLSTAPQAQEMSYSNLDFGWLSTDLDDGPTVDGFGLRGSVGFAENFFVFAEYGSQEAGSADVDQYAVGLGGHYALAENLDLVGRLGYMNAEISAGPFSDDEDGYLFSAGLRGHIAPGFELEGGAIHRDFGGGADDTALVIGGRYFFTDNLAINAEYEHGDDAGTLFAGIRLTF